MTVHSTDPWKIQLKGNRISILSNSGIRIAGVYGSDAPSKYRLDRALANASRIASCVNACAGIHNDDLDELIGLGKLLLGEAIGNKQ